MMVPRGGARDVVRGPMWPNGQLAAHCCEFSEVHNPPRDPYYPQVWLSSQPADEPNGVAIAALAGISRPASYDRCLCNETWGICDGCRRHHADVSPGPWARGRIATRWQGDFRCSPNVSDPRSGCRDR